MQAIARKYTDGIEVKRDPVLAALWRRKAAERRHVPAMIDYSLVLMRGEGVRQHRMEGYRWRERAVGAALKSTRVVKPVAALMSRPDAFCYWQAAEFDTGATFADLNPGECLPVDEPRAPFTAAAETGSPWVLYSLAIMHAAGLGGPRDPVQATQLCERAAAALAVQRAIHYGDGAGAPPVRPLACDTASLAAKAPP